MADVPAFRPFTVTIKTASLLTGISRSRIYEAIGRGELDAVKDGERTLITMASIERRQSALPKAKIAAPKPPPRTPYPPPLPAKLERCSVRPCGANQPAPGGPVSKPPNLNERGSS